ncbi:MAG: hypothetical protein P1U56_16175 [Saprospiraceae bacterium]|nr:hypothetical protein [Saprospiraceae bacterium]
MKYTLILLSLLCSTTFWAQDVLVNAVSSDMRSISEQDIKDRFLSSIEDEYNLYYVELALEEIEETKMAGIDSKVVLLSDFTIKLYSLLDESLVAVNTIKITASGRNIEKARKNALRSLKKFRKKINTFLKENTQGIETDCSKIAGAVDAYLSTENFTKAYALASNSSEPCAEQMWTLKQKVYDRYQEEYCEDHIIKVEALLSIKEYEKAIKELLNISPDSKCRDKLVQIVQTISETYQTDYDDSYKAYLKYLEVNSQDQRDRRELIDLLLIKSIIND